MRKILIITFVVVALYANAQTTQPKTKAIFLQQISWTTARDILTPDAVVVIPLGAGSKEHGPHLPLSSDYIQAEGCINEIAKQRKVIVAPTINYGFYPSFLKYNGSTSLTFSTSTDVVLQVVRALSDYGPKRFYIINIGVSTSPTLVAAAKILAEEGILLYFSTYNNPNFEKAEAKLKTKDFGGHANEIETSNILYLRPDLVDMRKAENDSSIKGKTGIMTPIPLPGGNLNTTGINGYAKLGTKEKGRLSTIAYAAEAIKQIDSITTCALPVAKDRSKEYAAFEGEYLDASGKKLVITQKDNWLHYVWNNLDTRSFFHLSKDADDHFTSLPMDVLFVRDEKGDVMKAWCRFRGESFWVVKQAHKWRK